MIKGEWDASLMVFGKALEDGACYEPRTLTAKLFLASPTSLVTTQVYLPTSSSRAFRIWSPRPPGQGMRKVP